MRAIVMAVALLAVPLAGCDNGGGRGGDRPQRPVDARARAAGEAEANQIIKDARIDALEAQIADLGKQLATVKAEVATTPPPPPVVPPPDDPGSPMPDDDAKASGKESRVSAATATGPRRPPAAPAAPAHGNPADALNGKVDLNRLESP